MSDNIYILHVILKMMKALGFIRTCPEAIGSFLSSFRFILHISHVHKQEILKQLILRQRHPVAR